MKKNLNMTEKQIIDRLDSINLSLRQKKDLIDVIKDITANSGGGGGGSTSTDKDALYIDLDYNDMTVTVNAKKFSMYIEDSFLKINSKELYDILYNSLFNTYRFVFIKSIDNDNYIFGQPTILINNNSILLSTFCIDGITSLAVYNQ